MSAVPNQHPAATLANHLLSVATSTEQERLFKQALGSVSAKRPNASVDDTVWELQKVQNPDDLVVLLSHWRTSNDLWKQPGATSKLRRAARVSETILRFKPLGDGLVQINSTIAGPVWGVVCTALSIIKSVTDTDEQMDHVMEELEASFENVQGIFFPGDVLNSELQARIRRFYEVVIEFCLDVAGALKQAIPGTYASAIVSTLYNKLVAFNKELDSVLKRLDRAVDTDSRRDIKSIKNSSAFQPNIQAPAVPTVKLIRNTPNILSTSFVGRTKELNLMHKSLTRVSPDYRPQLTALVGMSGVGKTQLAMQYVQRYIYNDQQLRQCSVIFIQAQNRASILSAFGVIGEKLKLCNSELASTNTAELIGRVKNELETMPGWLLIFDSVSDSNDLRDFVPSAGAGHVLVTTTNELVARTLIAWPDNIISVDPLDANGDGQELVFRIAPNAQRTSVLQQRSARKIVELVGGLPIAIEQVVKNAQQLSIDWEQMIRLCEDKRLLLKQKNFNSDYNHNESVGAVFQMSLESLEARKPMAAALFRILVCLNPSNIQLGLLLRAKSELEEHFKRPWSYMLGATDPAKPMIVPPAEKHSRSSSRFSPMRFLKDCKIRNTQSDTELPRIDSEADIKLKKYWDRQQHVTQAVLDDPIYIESAIQVLVSAGLVKRTSDTALEIHDLCAAMIRALMETKCKEDYVSVVHLSSTMVYLTFPTPELGAVLASGLPYVPHAITVHDHLDKMGILTDVTIGAELSHMIGSYMEAASMLSSRSYIEGANWTTTTEYYRKALEGYQAACQRLENTPGVTWNTIVQSTLADYALESARKVEPTINRHMDGFERLGRSAHWRTFNTYAKLGMALMQAGMLDEALKQLTMATDWYKKVFGLSHDDTIYMLQGLVYIYVRKNDFESARQVALQRAKGYMYWREVKGSGLHGLSRNSASIETSVSLVSTIEGVKIASQLGSVCIRIPGREREALLWFETKLYGYQNIYGQDSDWCTTSMKHVAYAHHCCGNTEACIYWLARAVDASLENFEVNMLYKYGEEHWIKKFSDDNDIDGAVYWLREATTNVADLPAQLESYVWQVLLRCGQWDKLRKLRNEEERILKQKDDDEYDEYRRKLDDFQENYPPAQHVSLYELEQLYAEMGHLYCSNTTVN